MVVVAGLGRHTVGRPIVGCSGGRMWRLEPPPVCCLEVPPEAGWRYRSSVGGGTGRPFFSTRSSLFFPFLSPVLEELKPNQPKTKGNDEICG
jgi:hypothetical protein